MVMPQIKEKYQTLSPLCAPLFKLYLAVQPEVKKVCHWCWVSSPAGILSMSKNFHHISFGTIASRAPWRLVSKYRTSTNSILTEHVVEACWPFQYSCKTMASTISRLSTSTGFDKSYQVFGDKKKTVSNGNVGVLHTSFYKDAVTLTMLNPVSMVNLSYSPNPKER